MNYNEMSDFEINKLVALRTEKRVSNEHECLKTGACYLMTDTHDVRVPFNPCNNPSDAWPIIFENKLSITTWGSRNDFWKATDASISDQENPNAVHVADKNPLRAAMICFLEMKDLSHE